MAFTRRLGIAWAAITASMAIAVAASAAPPSTAGAKVALRATTLGKILVDGKGRTLYLFGNDRSAKSACYGACATQWLPLLTRGTPRVGIGLRPRLLGTSARRDGKLQVTYNSHPLYVYAGDKKAGQTTGQGVGNRWFVVSAAGRKIATPPSSGATGGGYGAGNSASSPAPAPAPAPTPTPAPTPAPAPPTDGSPAVEPY